MSFQVQHSIKAMEFFIKFSSGSKAYLQYEQLPNGVLDFLHTVTPKDQQGKGIARTLVQEGFRYAAQNNLKVKPTCTYVVKFVNDFATEEQKKLTTTYNN